MAACPVSDGGIPADAITFSKQPAPCYLRCLPKHIELNTCASRQPALETNLALPAEPRRCLRPSKSPGQLSVLVHKPGSLQGEACSLTAMALLMGPPSLGSGRFSGSPCQLHSLPRPARQHRMLPQTIECKESRIGRAPIPIPSGVNVKNEGLTYTVKVQPASSSGPAAADQISDLSRCSVQGPKGELVRTFSPLVKIDRLVRGAARRTCWPHTCAGLTCAAECRKTVRCGCGGRRTPRSRMCFMACPGALVVCMPAATAAAAVPRPSFPWSAQGPSEQHGQGCVGGLQQKSAAQWRRLQGQCGRQGPAHEPGLQPPCADTNPRGHLSHSALGGNTARSLAARPVLAADITSYCRSPGW